MLDNTKFFAYGERRHMLETIMRMQAVRRWHMIETGGRSQTLAEHSANVAALAFYIAVAAPMNFFVSAHSAMAYGLFHDAEEAFTGDIQTHVKQHLNSLSGDLKEMEDTLTPTTVKHCVITGIDKNTKTLVKLCDLADGIRFIRIHGKDSTAIHAQVGLELQLQDLSDYCRGDLAWPFEVINLVIDITRFYAYESH